MAIKKKDFNGLILPGEPQYERRPSGYILMKDPLSSSGDWIETASTLRCVHGGEHFISVKGSGKQRGFCLRCAGVTCGAAEHDGCLHWEKRLEQSAGNSGDL